MATVSEKISDVELYLNPNAVKVVADSQQLALYFSRAPIPWHRDLLADSNANKSELTAFLETQNQVQKHIGIYAYRVALLRAFSGWEPRPIEKIEKLEQLRVLSQGHRIHVEEACAAVPGGVDTEEDLNRVRALIAAL